MSYFLIFLVIFVLSILNGSHAYFQQFSLISKKATLSKQLINPYSRIHNNLNPSNTNTLDEDVRMKIDSVIANNRVVLFMKGTKSMPMCGFSYNALKLLLSLKVPFEVVNVLDDPKIRNGIKVYSSWPTIPQLYIDKEFIGGSDIMSEMAKTGDLQKRLQDLISQSS